MATSRAYAPTARKLAYAREQGDVPRSAELALAAVVGAAWLAWSATAPALGRALARLFDASLRAQGDVLHGLGAAVGVVVSAAAPLLWAPALAALAVALVQGGFVLAGRSRGQAIGASLHDGLLSAIKASILAAVLVGTLWRALPGLLDAWQHDIAELGMLGTTLIEALLARATGVLLALGVADYVYQAVRRARRLRMTHSELQDERRELEGDPHLRAERGRRAREAVLQAGVLELSRATLVIHDGAERAVALRFDPAEHPAPRLWIKVESDHALRLRQHASERGLPVHMDAPLAAALAQLEVAQPIGGAHYAAVAQWLAAGAPRP
jgi:flagellar biosynthesis protein FlhB